LHSRWMPSSNARNFSETLMGFSGEASGSPTGGDTLETMTLRNSDHVNVLVLLENGCHIDWLLEQIQSEIHLLTGRSSIHLDFHDMRLLLAEVELADLGVGDDADHRAKLLDPLNVEIDSPLLFFSPHTTSHTW